MCYKSEVSFVGLSSNSPAPLARFLHVLNNTKHSFSKEPGIRGCQLEGKGVWLLRGGGIGMNYQVSYTIQACTHTKVLILYKKKLQSNRNEQSKYT